MGFNIAEFRERKLPGLRDGKVPKVMRHIEMSNFGFVNCSVIKIHQLAISQVFPRQTYIVVFRESLIVAFRLAALNVNKELISWSS